MTPYIGDVRAMNYGTKSAEVIQVINSDEKFVTVIGMDNRRREIPVAEYRASVEKYETEFMPYIRWAPVRLK